MWFYTHLPALDRREVVGCPGLEKGEDLCGPQGHLVPSQIRTWFLIWVPGNMRVPKYAKSANAERCMHKPVLGACGPLHGCMSADLRGPEQQLAIIICLRGAHSYYADTGCFGCILYVRLIGFP
jgi:hypothetical protein